MPKSQLELFNNDLNLEDPEIYKSFEDAHMQSIRTAGCNLLGLLKNENGYIIDIDVDTDLDEIASACRDFLKAVKGKFVSKYILDDSE